MHICDADSKSGGLNYKAVMGGKAYRVSFDCSKGDCRDLAEVRTLLILNCFNGFQLQCITYVCFFFVSAST